MTTKNTPEKYLKSHKSKARNSGIELLKIIAVFLICISHAVQTSEQFLDYSSLSFEMMLLHILKYSGLIGNVLFIICSAWFLLDSKRTKLEKILNILLDSMLISISIFLGFIVFGYNFSFQETIRQIFPDLFANLWFIPAYVIFYIMHPLFNKMINTMTKNSHLIFCLGIFVIIDLLGIALNGNGIIMNSFIGFCIIYFIFGFIKKYCKCFCENRTINIIGFLIFLFAFIILEVLKNIYNLNFLNLQQFYSPILPCLICLFNIFNSFKFQNKTINYLASCSLFVYCIHENILLRLIVRPMYYEKVLSISFNAYLGWVLLCAVGMFIGAYIISILYKKTLSKITKKISIILTKAYTKVRDKILFKTKK